MLEKLGRVKGKKRDTECDFQSKVLSQNILVSFLHVKFYFGISQQSAFFF